MRPYRLDVDPANVDPDGLADGNSSAGATLTLDGALTSGGTFTSADGYGHRISILDLGADDQTGATYTFTGTNSNGEAQTEDIAGPGVSGTVTTTKYWLTVTSVTIAVPAAGSTVDVGTVDEIATPVLPVNWRGSEACTAAVTGLSGTCQFDINETFDAIQETEPTDTTNWITKASNQSADVVQAMSLHATAVRLVFDSYTDGAELQLAVFQGNG